jgi:hypothetical protein
MTATWDNLSQVPARAVKRSESERGTRVRKTDIVPHSFAKVVIYVMKWAN